MGHFLAVITLVVLGAAMLQAAVATSPAVTALPAVAGPLKISADKRSFVASDGTPFLFLGDTAWSLCVQLNRDEIGDYLINRARRGFSVSMTVLAWSGGTGMEGKLPAANRDGVRPWIDGDPARPDPAYFALVDDLLLQAERQGIVMALLPSWGNFVDSRVLNAGNARAYGAWLGARYRDRPNLIWVTGGDRDPRGKEKIYRELAAGLAAGDGRHLITYHTFWHSSSAQWFHQEDWLDFNMIQTWEQYATIPALIHADRARTLVKPTGLAEGQYEDGPEYPNRPVNAVRIRNQAWWSYLSGGYHIYGNTNIWSFNAYPKFSTQPWREALDSPGAVSLGVLRTILTAQAWQRLVPDQRLLVAGAGSGATYDAAAIADDRTFAFVYRSSPGGITIDLGRIDARGAVRATWFDPGTGVATTVGSFPASGSQQFTHPFASDGILLLEAFAGSGR